VCQLRRIERQQNDTGRRFAALDDGGRVYAGVLIKRRHLV
jgi:hypothetical protein